MMNPIFNWDPNPEIVNIFGFSIRYYGVIFGFGLMSSIYVLKHLFKINRISSAHLDKLVICGTVGILVGARFGHCFFYEPSYYLAHPLEILLPITFNAEGGFEIIGYRGLASHGGVLGLLLGALFYSRRTKQSLIQTFDLIAVAAGVCFGFIRIANFMNSEIIGIPTSGSWGIIFERVDSIPRHPAQLYETLSYFAIFLIMILFYKTQKDRCGKGFFFGLASVLFFSARFFLEFMKENQVAFEDELTFNMGQILSIPFILIGIGFVVMSYNRRINSI